LARFLAAACASPDAVYDHVEKEGNHEYENDGEDEDQDPLGSERLGDGTQNDA
jgi:hypothetical protein